MFSAGVGHDVCTIPRAAYSPGRVLTERDGVLEEVVALAPWARGIDLRNASGWQWYQLQHADGDPSRLRQIQAARGYKPGWVRYTAQEAAEVRATRGVAP